jgi:hypothetical protein
LKKALEIEIINYEKSFKELIGKAISHINYYEIDYGKPMWNETKFHSVDYGFEITMLDKTSYYFIWSNKFTQYDVKFKKGNILIEFGTKNSAKKYNVSDNINWTDLIGTKIKEVKSCWSYWYTMGEEEKTYYPQDVHIQFENGKEIWISALEIIDNSPIPMQDNLLIVFDKGIAEKYNIGNKDIG